MSLHSVRRTALPLLLLSGAILATACEDKAVKDLNAGISKDSALTVIVKDKQPGNSKPDSLPNIYTTERYLINAKNYEVLYYAGNDKKAGKDTVAWSKLTPIVFVDNKLAGRGWPFWDSVSKSLRILVKKH